MVFYYVVEVNAGENVEQTLYLSAFPDMYAKGSDMVDSIFYMISNLRTGENYTLKVYPNDNFGKTGKPISIELSTP